MPGPFELTTFGDGTPKRVDWKTRAALEEAQALLGYPLTVVQGSYNHGASRPRPAPTTAAAWSTCSPGTGSARSRRCGRSASRRGTAPRSAASGARTSTPS